VKTEGQPDVSSLGSDSPIILIGGRESGSSKERLRLVVGRRNAKDEASV
jgi:hypothetical protein